MGGKAPKAPDPAKTAAAQGAWDMTTSQSNAITNNANVVNPYGSTSYSVSGYETVTGPNGQQIQVPRYTQTQKLSPVAQKQFDDRNAVINQLFGKASSGGSTYDVGQLKDTFESANLKDYFKSAKLDTGFTGTKLDAGFKGTALDKNYLRPEEASMATNRQNVERAIMDRANPLLEESRNSEVARLAAMGLAPGGAKYGRVSDQFEKSKNDLALAAVEAGGAEQSRLLDLYNKGTGFINDARLAEGDSFNNARSMSNDARLAQDTSFNNARGWSNDAIMKGVDSFNNSQNLSNATRLAQADSRNNATGLSNSAKVAQTGLNANARSSLINELLGMMTGQQPGAQAQGGFQGFGMQSPNYTGLTQDKYNADVGKYNNKQAGLGNMASMLFGFL